MGNQENDEELTIITHKRPAMLLLIRIYDSIPLLVRFAINTRCLQNAMSLITRLSWSRQ
jgi:hypothetical protein